MKTLILLSVFANFEARRLPAAFMRSSRSNTGNVPGGKTATQFWATVLWQQAVYREQSNNKLSSNSGSNVNNAPRGSIWLVAMGWGQNSNTLLGKLAK